ncbi:MAG: ribonuclease P protein component [Candidatus Doudnabacteria bacterium]|nr:ribonuclease P protein component [Candidatus Doudnabacteria bacterium]
MFKRKHRLAKTTSVVAALKNGRGFFNPEINIRFLPTVGMDPKFTIVVSTKVDKRAVRRNRLKRIIRELINQNLTGIRPGDYVIMLKPRAAKVEEALLLKNLLTSLVGWGLLRKNVTITKQN